MTEEYSRQNKRNHTVIRHWLDSIRNAKSCIVHYLAVLKTKAARKCSCEEHSHEMQRPVAQSLFQEVKLQNHQSASLGEDWVQEGIYVDSNAAGYRLPDEWVSPSGPKPPTHAAPVIRQ